MADQQPAEPSRRAMDEPASPAAATFRRSTLVITNVTKLTGLVIAFHEAVLQRHHDPATLALAAFCMAGGQFSEGLILALADRFFGGSPK